MTWECPFCGEIVFDTDLTDAICPSCWSDWVMNYPEWLAYARAEAEEWSR